MTASMRNPERWEELVADDALVGLTVEERAELATLIVDDVVEAELPLFQRAAGELAAAAFEAQEEREKLPASLETKLEAKLIARMPAPRRVIADIRDERTATAKETKFSWGPWVLAAAAIAIAVTGWVRQPVVRLPPPPPPMQERIELLALPGTVRTDFAATTDPAAKRASGDVSWHSGLQRGYMRIHGLEVNDPKLAQYQLWIFDSERGETFPVDGGVFDVAANEQGEVVIPIQAKLSVGKAKLFAITVEKPGGVVVSKRERIVLTATPS